MQCGWVLVRELARNRLDSANIEVRSEEGDPPLQFAASAKTTVQSSSVDL